MALLGEVDGLVFTGGIGENSAVVRRQAVENLRKLGLRLDAQANEAVAQGQAKEISAADSEVKILVIPTNEELLIARQTLALAGS
jgi:acetate kinase